VDKSFMSIAEALLVHLDLTYALQTFDAPKLNSVLDLFEHFGNIVKPENIDALSELLAAEAALNPWMKFSPGLEGYTITADTLANKLMRTEPLDLYGNNPLEVLHICHRVRALLDTLYTSVAVQSVTGPNWNV
jgi:hypothetical protein